MALKQLGNLSTNAPWLGIATLSIVAVAPLFSFGHLNYACGHWPCGGDSFRQVIITHRACEVCSVQNRGSEAYRPWGASAQKLKLMMFQISLEGLNGNENEVGWRNKRGEGAGVAGGGAGQPVAANLASSNTPALKDIPSSCFFNLWISSKSQSFDVVPFTAFRDSFNTHFMHF